MRKYVVIFLVLSILMLPGKIYAETYSVPGTIITTDNQKVSMQSLQGNYTLLDIMATWCGPCEVMMPALIDVHDTAKNNENFKMFSVSPDEGDTLKKLEDFKEDNDGTWPFALDINQTLMEHFNIQGYPTTILLDPNGEVLKKWLGITDSEEILLEMDKYLDLPGELGRQLSSIDLVNDLLSSPFFIFFLIFFWITIFLLGFKVIRQIHPANQNDNSNLFPGDEN